MKGFVPRSLVSLGIALSFLVLASTGLLLYFVKHSNLTAALHTSFGAIFLGAAALHVRNNFKSLKNYGYAPHKARALFRNELYVLVGLVALGVAATLYEVPGFSAIYAWGNSWRSQQENKQETQLVQQHIQTMAGQGLTLALDVRKGKAFTYPLFAAWTEDAAGRFLQTLYVSKVIGTSQFEYGKRKDGKWVPDVVRRPEALPYWGHRRGVQARDGYFLPDPDAPLPDAVSAATPTENFRLLSRADKPASAFRVYLEVNQSFDWNDYYSKTRFPDDPIYSGSGQNAQPSVVYAADVALTPDSPRYYAMNVVGHGHPSGADGALDPDLSQLTTALDILDGVLLKIVEP